MAIVGSFDATLPLFVKRSFGWDSSGVGLIFLVITTPALAGAVFGALSDYYGTKRVFLLGSLIATLSLVLLALIKDNNMAYKVGLAILLVALGELLALSRSHAFSIDPTFRHRRQSYSDIARGTYAL